MMAPLVMPEGSGAEVPAKDTLGSYKARLKLYEKAIAAFLQRFAQRDAGSAPMARAANRSLGAPPSVRRDIECISSMLTPGVRSTQASPAESDSQLTTPPAAARSASRKATSTTLPKKKKTAHLSSWSTGERARHAIATIFGGRV